VIPLRFLEVSFLEPSRLDKNVGLSFGKMPAAQGVLETAHLELRPALTALGFYSRRGKTQT
jgi:hypothetical protein